MKLIRDLLDIAYPLTLAIAAVLLCTSGSNASDQKARGRSAWAWAVSSNSSESPNSSTITQPNKSNESSPLRLTGSDDALDEVNSYRAKRGLPAFQHDPQLTIAAKRAAETRAKHLWNGHLTNDFACLPPGASADAAGCGALEDSWGWGTCCMDDNYSHAGAAWVRGSDGKRYMHLFVRNGSQPATTTKPTIIGPPQATGEVVNSYGTCSTGQCSNDATIRQYGGILSRGKRGR